MLSAVGKLVKYSVAIGASGAVVGTLHANDWQTSNLGVTRFGRAAYTVASIAADYKLSLRNLDDDNESSKTAWSKVHTRSAEKLLKLCSINGGVFVKVGQHIGSLEYLVPNEYCQVLKVLHDRAPESSIESIKKVIEKDLGSKADEIFAEFGDKPLGTASLAQVYKAKLRNGQTVAVKVQHPDVRSHSLVDMACMEMLVRIVAKIFPEFSFLWLAEETKKNLPLELDFEHEGRNCERVGRMFSHFSWFKVPTIYWDYSSKRVLTMEYLEGGKVDDKDFMKQSGISTRKLSHRLGLLYSEMIFMQGYVHCDPHPGNILVSSMKGEPQIILLDHGLYTTLPEQFRHQYSHLWLSMIDSDIEGIKKWGKELAGDLFPFLACILAGKTWDTITTGLTKARSKAQIESEDAGLKNYARQYFPEIAAILNRVPREMLLLLKTNDLLRSIEYSLGTKGERTSLLTMAKCCVRSIFESRIRECRNILSTFYLKVQKNWKLAKISFYQFYLWLTCLIVSVTYLAM